MTGHTTNTRNTMSAGVTKKTISSPLRKPEPVPRRRPFTGAAGSAITLPAAPVKGRRRGMGSGLRKNLEIVFFVTPALLVFLVFVVWPVVKAIQYSLFSWKGYGPLVDFVGLQNYLYVLKNEVFQDALVHNLIIVVLSIAIQLPLGLAIALLLNRKIRGQG